MNDKIGGYPDFKATTSWLMRFKSRHGISQLNIQGEKLSANTEAAEHFKESFKNMIDKEGYNKSDVYNADETESITASKEIPNSQFVSELAELITKSSVFEACDSKDIQDWLECDVDDPGYQLLTDDEILESVVNDQGSSNNEEELRNDDQNGFCKDDFLHYATNPESELEDTDSDCTIVYDYEESSGEDEEVPPPLKTPRSDYIWSDNSNYDPIIFSFDRSNSGLQVDTCRLEKELDFFEIFININFLEMIAVETNKYAKYLIDTIEFSKFSRMNRWVDTNYHELFVFLAICFLMTRNKKVSLKEYWSTNQLHFFPIFSKLMSRDRFFLILSVLHFNDNKTQIPGDKLHKLKPVVDHMKSAYKNAFKPFQDVCIDEGLVLFKGRLGFKRYIPSKRKRFGIKLFVLCDVETKYILDFIVYVGKGTEIEDSDMGVSSSVITTLLQPYMNKGHSLWVDNWYSSPTLFNFLHQRQTNACGTVRKNRKEMPRFGKKLKIGETEAKHTQNLLALKYKDKREVFMLSTMHKNEFANTNKRDKVTNLPIQKPSAVIDYNQKMGTVDQTDMLLSSIGCLRKSLKWYKKLFFHFIDTSLLNAYSLYLVNTGKRPSLAEFHINLIGQIIEKYHEARVQVHRGRPSTSEDRPLRLIERHFPSLVPPTEKKKNPTRYCRVCGANKKRKESRYMCKDCDVALCVVPCFETYPTIKNF
ncbi:hypothetical protein LAZ67_14001866 [Cordylochernes scorpioides]|uniref:HTH CENPB-type domain-containing protein n=1 Tax=Cordylochernes scorpioides TaxID=51811 RepID=A0ABY6L6S8_9ARAC|nr:hypothetical protein LAZ67_14001866 [Cordylochernes scorpioides]